MRGRVLASALTAAAVLLAAPAHANSDDGFLAALDSHGITYPSRQEAIVAGNTVCYKLSSGETPLQVAYDVFHSSQLDARHSGIFVIVSMRAYCPWRI